MSSRELAERLEAIGVKGMNERTISNKVNRGTFSAVFRFQVMEEHPPGRRIGNMDHDKPSSAYIKASITIEETAEELLAAL